MLVEAQHKVRLLLRPSVWARLYKHPRIEEGASRRVVARSSQCPVLVLKQRQLVCFRLDSAVVKYVAPFLHGLCGRRSDVVGGTVAQYKVASLEPYIAIAYDHIHRSRDVAVLEVATRACRRVV